MHTTQTELVQAPKEEDILGPPVPRQSAHADLLLLKEGLSGMRVQNLKGAKHSGGLLAVEDVHTRTFPRIRPQPATQSRWEEDHVRVDFHSPIAPAVAPVCPHRVPHSQEALRTLPGGLLRSQLPEAAPGRRDDYG